MENKDKEKEIEKNLEELNYAPLEDIFIKAEHISLDAEGIPLLDELHQDAMAMDLDVPGSDLDNEQEEIGSEDEENNYYSLSDNEDKNESANEDIIN